MEKSKKLIKMLRPRNYESKIKLFCREQKVNNLIKRVNGKV